MTTGDPENKAQAEKRAQEYWAQSRADLAAAHTLRDAGVYFAAVFFAQQAAEKALRYAHLHLSGTNLRGHNLIQFADSLQAPIEIMNATAVLNLAFLTTRYPEYANEVPANHFDAESAECHLQASQTIIAWVRKVLP